MTEQARPDKSLGTSIRARGLAAIGLEIPVRWWIDDGSVPREAARACRRQALVLWPRLDPYRLARTRGDPWRIARLVARRTPRSLDEIVAMLTTHPGLPDLPGTVSDRAIPLAARTVSRG